VPADTIDGVDNTTDITNTINSILYLSIFSNPILPMYIGSNFNASNKPSEHYTGSQNHCKPTLENNRAGNWGLKIAFLDGKMLIAYTAELWVPKHFGK
jgi:hypothetical protein